MPDKIRIKVQWKEREVPIRAINDGKDVTMPRDLIRRWEEAQSAYDLAVKDVTDYLNQGI